MKRKVMAVVLAAVMSSSLLAGCGGSLCDLVFESCRITDGKPALKGLPATYCESEEEARTLHIFVSDPLTGVRAELLYTVFEAYPALTRSVRFENPGKERVFLDTAMSLNLDLPDAEYDLVQLSGAWCRERFVHRSPLRPGIQSIQSLRGHSSHNHNPFLALARPGADEGQGEVIGISLVYSGNFCGVPIFSGIYKGKALLDLSDKVVRHVYYSREKDPEELDFLWYLWCGKRVKFFCKLDKPHKPMVFTVLLL